MKNVWLLLAFFPASLFAQSQFGVVTPFVNPDGAHLFTYIVTIDDRALEKQNMTRAQHVQNNLSRLLAAERWCLDGWEITDQYESDDILVVEGRCIK